MNRQAAAHEDVGSGAKDGTGAPAEAESATIASRVVCGGRAYDWGGMRTSARHGRGRNAFERIGKRGNAVVGGGSHTVRDTVSPHDSN